MDGPQVLSWDKVAQRDGGGPRFLLPMEGIGAPTAATAVTREQGL